MTNDAALKNLIVQRDLGRIWVSATEAAEILGCQAASLTNAANKKGTLGSLQYFWAGSVLKISVLRDVFVEVR